MNMFVAGKNNNQLNQWFKLFDFKNCAMNCIQTILTTIT